MVEALAFYGVTPATQIDWDQWMTFSTAIAAVATGIAAIFTAWNAWESRKMASIAQQQLSITTRPYLSMETNLIIKPFPSPMQIAEKIQIAVPLKNVGNVPLEYSIVKVCLNEKEEDKIGDHSRTSIIFPGCELEFMCWYNIEKPARKTIDLALEIEYWALGNANKKFLRSRITRLSFTKGDIGIIKDLAT